MAPQTRPVALLTAADIAWTIGDVSPWTPADDVLNAASALLVVIEDDDAAALVEQLALAVVEARERQRATGDLLAEALGEIHRLRNQVRRLRARLSS